MPDPSHAALRTTTMEGTLMPHREGPRPNRARSRHLQALSLAGALVVLIAPIARAADEIHWNLRDQTSVTVSWRGSETTVRYGTTTSYGQTATASTPIPLPFSSAGPFKEARLTGLTENTLYHYSIGTGPDHTFRTPPPRGSSDFTVYSSGDIGDTGSYSTVGPMQALVAADPPRFCLLLGDLTYANAHGQAACDQHFNDVMAWSQDVAYMPAWGNHEWDIPSADDMRNYKGRFDLPNPRSSPSAPSPPGPGDDWYWFDYGNVRFIAFPEPYTSAAWSDWATRADSLMDAAQADPTITFIVTFGHRPAYSSGHHPGSSTLAGYMGTLGAQHSKYKLNLNGHSHNYERTHPQSGVTHITAGGGGSGLQTDGSCGWLGGCPAPAYTAFRAMRHGWLKLRFTATSIEGTAICGPSASNQDLSCTLGSAFDTFVIAAPGGDLTPPSRSTNLRTRP